MNIKPMRFLVVEDHPEVAQNNCDFLKKFDSSAICSIASTPQEAIQRLKIAQHKSCLSLMISGQDARTTRNFWVFF
jgi:response regulator of citrate/malate metabolism